jgi:polysaccharide chain length determinant protein (PEP-CTERM system associated)
MLGQRALTGEEYLELLRRRWWILLIPALLGPAIGYGVSLFVSEKYTSQTLVLVEQPRVPDRIIPPIVIEELAQTLGTMQEKILSRARLEPLVREHNLFVEDAQKHPMEDLVGRMRKAVKVTPVRAVGNRPDAGVPGFTISFTYSEPRTAQLICNQITSMFIQEDLIRREGRAQGTVDFIESQLQEAKRKLDEQDAKLAEFKRRHIGQMPGKEDVSFGLLMSSNAQLEANTQALNRATADKSYAEAQLQQFLAVATTSPDGSSPMALEKQLSTLQSQLVTLEGRYTPSHPDVVKMKNEIAQLQKRIDEQNRAAKAAPAKKVETAGVVIEPPHVQQLRNQIRLLDQTIKEKTRDQARLQESIRTFQARVQLSPQIEQEYKELTRDYDTAMGFYNDLLGKKTASEMSIQLMKQQQGEQFRIMDSANLPASPSEPNRLMFAGGGLGGGLALGLGIVLLLEMKDKAMRNELDIEYFLELPALAQVPTVGVETRSRRGGSRKKKPAPVEQAARA